MSEKKKSIVVKSTLGVGIVCIIVVALMIAQGLFKQPVINENKQEIAEYESKIEAAKQEQAEVDRMIENSDSDEFVEKVARDELGMVKSDEIVFYDVSEK